MIVLFDAVHRRCHHFKISSHYCLPEYSKHFDNWGVPTKAASLLALARVTNFTSSHLYEQSESSTLWDYLISVSVVCLKLLLIQDYN